MLTEPATTFWPARYLRFAMNETPSLVSIFKTPESYPKLRTANDQLGEAEQGTSPISLGK